MDETSSPPRKRAAIACDLCRKRKRRCDGEKPRCKLCRDLDKQCHYEREANSRQQLFSVSNEVFQRLERLESSMQRQLPAMTPPILEQMDYGETATDVVETSLEEHTAEAVFSDRGNSVSFPSPDQPLSFRRDEDSRNAMTIPFGHSTTTGSLLHMPQTSSLLGSYPVDLFLRIEQRRIVPPELSLSSFPATSNPCLDLDQSLTDQLVETFFLLVHKKHPILEENEFRQTYESAKSRLFQDDNIEHARCLLVFALAEIASQTPDLKTDSWMSGVSHFTPALHILIKHWMTSFGAGLALPQSLYLAALYYSYLARPLLAWRMVHIASTNVQQLHVQYESMRNGSEGGPKYDSIIRLAWAIFVLECDIIAEYHLPRSSIEHMVENLPLPSCGNPPEQHLLLWLADISARRLLNRVHHTLYNNAVQTMTAITTSAAESPGTVHNAMGSYLNVSNELRRQLETWYNYLPADIRPDLTARDISADKAKLVLRYHAAGDIISRPFVLHACALPGGTEPPEFLMEQCSICIYHCCEYLRVFDTLVESPSASTEIFLHSTLAVMVILTLASVSPLLRNLVPDLNELQGLGMSAMERWAFPGSSVESMLSIFKILAMKRQMMEGFVE